MNQSTDSKSTSKTQTSNQVPEQPSIQTTQPEAQQKLQSQDSPCDVISYILDESDIANNNDFSVQNNGYDEQPAGVSIEDYKEKRFVDADMADRMDKHRYKRRGFQLILLCILLYTLIVVGDSFLKAYGLEISTYVDGFIELIKFLISTLVGFVFADSFKGSNGKEDTTIKKTKKR